MGQLRPIAILLPSLRGGGAERVCVTLANALSRQRMAVDLVLVKKEGPYLDDVDDRVRLVDLGRTRVATSLFRLMRYLRAEQPVALLSTFNHASLVALIARALTRTRVRIVVRVPNTISQAARWSSRRFADRLLGWIAPRVYASADAIIAVSEGVAADLCRRKASLKSRIHVIFNPVIGPELTVRANAPLSHPLFAGPAPVILAVGTMKAHKDYDSLLRAFSILRKSRNARLLILGDGDERARLEKLARQLDIEEDVAMPGFERNPFPYMASAAVFVLSSRTEGLPNVLIQALALRARIVATDCPSGPREILEGGRYGELVGVGEVDALAAAIARALDGPRPDVPAAAVARYQVDTVSRQYRNLLVPM